MKAFSCLIFSVCLIYASQSYVLNNNEKYNKAPGNTQNLITFSD